MRSRKGHSEYDHTIDHFVPTTNKHCVVQGGGGRRTSGGHRRRSNHGVRAFTVPPIDEVRECVTKTMTEEEMARYKPPQRVGAKSICSFLTEKTGMKHFGSERERYTQDLHSRVCVWGMSNKKGVCVSCSVAMSDDEFEPVVQALETNIDWEIRRHSPGFVTIRPKVEDR